MNLKVYIKAQGAETGPPLGTILGNVGLNTIKFCKEFNDFTKELPSYFKIGVIISIEENKSYFFTTKEPTVGFILSLLKKEETYLNKDGSSSIYFYITVEDLFKLSKFKFPNLNFDKAVPILLGSLRSANIKVKC